MIDARPTLDEARSDNDYALRIVAASQSSAPSIGIDFNPEWVRVGLTPDGRATHGTCRRRRSSLRRPAREPFRLER
jgi:hypothetical protein